MPRQIGVGPPVITINQGSTFMVTDLNGEIAGESEQGVFAGDTRFVSYYAIFANGVPWGHRTSGSTNYYAGVIYLSNPPIAAENGLVIPEGSLGLVINRAVGDGIHEDLDVTNYGPNPVHFSLEVALRSDFADLFEVKQHKFVRRGRIETEWDAERGELRTSYANQDFKRLCIYRPQNSDSQAHYANGRVTFEIELNPGTVWHSCCCYILVEGERVREPVYSCSHEGKATELDILQRQWLASATELTSANEEIHQLYRQSVEDMGALRLHEHDLGANAWLPAAGVPWFVTLFGRDSLIVSLQNMLVDQGFARGALKKLAQHQATTLDDWRDAEPGKILHEIRVGELAHFNQIPHTPYYGTADATILYLIALHEAWKWLGDKTLLREHRDTALRCLDWIDQYGDLDGDGFQEYRTRSSQGYENMGWKDGADSIVYPDGRPVKQPKALCEIQGYVFDAWMRMAEVFEALDDPARAFDLRRKAVDLQDRFEKAFWCEDLGFYALGLDPEKHQIRTITSNPGHCLWSGIASPEHAAKVAKRLLQSDMWSGWGIRSLSAGHPGYNPYSYQRGSVWPHDNGIIALGLKRYGFAEEAARVAQGVSEAASYFAQYRLPELYAGIERSAGTFPVQCVGANVPQAWAAGSVFHLVQAMLGIQADAPHDLLYVDPQLPAWLPDITLRKLRIGQDEVDLRFWREGSLTHWDVSNQRTSSITVKQQAWQPWIPVSPVEEGVQETRPPSLPPSVEVLR